MVAPVLSSQPIAERLRHVCPEADCIYYGKPTTPGACGCHRTIDQMMLARIEELEGALREMLTKGCLIEIEGCDCESCAPVARARAALSPKPAGETHEET